MYVKKSNFAIFLAIATVAGFGISILISSLRQNSWPPQGSIAKAARYNNQKEDPMTTIIEEKLMNDEEFLDDTRSAMSILKERMTVLSELTEETVAACEGLPEFEPLMDEMKAINARSYNTASAMENAGKSLDKLAEGKKAPEYEMYSNQAYIGFCKVGNQMELGRKFCQTAADFLEGKEEGEYPQIAYLATVWEVYCLQDEQMFADWHCPDIDKRDTILQEPEWEGNRHKINISIPTGPRTGPGSGKLSNSVLDEHLLQVGEAVESANIDWLGLGAIVILEAFPTVEIYPGMSSFPNESQVESQTLNGKIEDR